MRRRVLLLCLCCLAVQAAQGAYIRRYAAVEKGAMTFTGNTLGLNKRYIPFYESAVNEPGSRGSIGAFTTLNTALQVTGGWPTGTTLDWTLNSSSAQLVVPTGSTILYAELIWGGCYYSTSGSGTQYNVTGSMDNAISFTTPSGTTSVSPAATTAKQVNGEGGNFYVRSQDVTTLVRNAYNSGVGSTYSVGGVPATVGARENNTNCAGWTLAVAYQNSTLPARNLNIFLGAEMVTPTTNSPVAAISGFCTPISGPVQARVMVTAMEGDQIVDGDSLRFGPTPTTMGNLSGTNNAATNFFNSIICNDTGAVDTTGVKGSPNNSPTNSPSGGRMGWDITNMAATLGNNQNTAFTQGSTDGDQYLISALGLQVDVGSPSNSFNAIQVNKASTTVGDTLTYTASYTNSGNADALDMVFTSPVPTGLSFIPGTVTVNGATQSTADPRSGVNVGTVAVGTTVTITWQCHVDAVPQPPQPARYVVTGAWHYKFASCPNYPLNEVDGTSPQATTMIPRLMPVKSASPTGALGQGQTVTYTITIPNSGTAPTANATLRDPIPSYLTYIANSTTLNGTAVADVAGAMPYSTAREIHAAGSGAGVIPVGGQAVVVFKATVNPSPPASIRNVAYIDPDGPGTAPEITASTDNPQLVADLGVTKTDGVTSVIAGNSTTYTLTVTNYGPSTTTALTLTDPLPAALLAPTYVASTGTYNPTSGVWTGLNLAAGQSITLQITARVDPKAQTTLTNTAYVSGSPGVQSDPNLANNQATDTDTIVRQADLSVVKTSGGNAFPQNGQATYTIAVTNNGPTSVMHVNLNDPDPPHMTWISATPSQGYFNHDTWAWTGVDLDAGETVTIQMVFALEPDYVGQVSNTATVSPNGTYTDPVSTNNSSTDTDTVTASSLYSISGYLYLDANHDGVRNGAETSPGPLNVYAKLVAVGQTTATAVVPVNNDTGFYSFGSVAAGQYNVQLSLNFDLNDLTLPDLGAWYSVNPPILRQAVTITNASQSQVNFGVYFGSKLSGVVFNDNGAGGGVLGDGIQNGTEVGIANATVTAYDTDSGVLVTTTTDATGAYTLWIEGSVHGETVTIAETPPAGYVRLSGQPGTTGGTFDLPNNRTTFTFASGQDYTGVNFGNVQTTTVSGYVYNDVNHNGQKDPGETGTGLTGLFAKGIRQGNTTATAAYPVDPATGFVTGAVMANTTITLYLDNNNDLTDVTPYLPPGWIGTEAPNQTIGPFAVGTTSIGNLNLGLYNGIKVSGRVFDDNGTGGGTANNAVQDGSEPGLPLVQLHVLDATYTVVAQVQTDANGDYTIWLPEGPTPVVRVVETNPTGYISTGGQVGNTGGTYYIGSDRTRFDAVWGTTYTGVNFADVREPTFVDNNQRSALPGTVVVYSHTFTSGTSGSVAFTQTQVDSPADPAWSTLLYLDVNGDGLLDPGDTLITGPIAVTGNQTVKILEVVNVPPTAGQGSSNLVTLTATMTLANTSPAVTWSKALTDLTTVGATTGITLTKAADKTTAAPGEIITYTLTYTNDGQTPVTNLVVNDMTPAYTTFVSAAYTTPLPDALTACAMTMPAAGATGEMVWTFTGTLNTGSTSTVTYQVKVDQ